MADIFDQLASEDKGLDIFDQIANDPGFFESLGQGFSRGAATVGTAKDILLTEAGVQSPERTAAGIARRSQEMAQIPGSVALRQFNESQGALDALGTIATNPSIIGELTAESIPISGATLVAGGAGGLVGGVPGAAAGAGLVSGGSEYLLALQDQLSEDGVDLQDQEAVAAKIKDPEFRASWRDRGVKRGAAIGAFDAAAMVIAGMFLAPVRKAALESGERMIGAQVRALGKEAGAQIAAGTLGETTGQLATGGIDSPQSIIAEGAAELPFSVVEAITGVQIRNRAANKISSAREAASAGMPATADILAQQAYNELTQPTDEATGVSPTQEQPTEPTVGKTLDDLISEVASQPASAPDLAGVTTTEEVINEPITDEQASDSPATEEASQEAEEVTPILERYSNLQSEANEDLKKIWPELSDSERSRIISDDLSLQPGKPLERKLRELPIERQNQIDEELNKSDGPLEKMSRIERARNALVGMQSASSDGDADAFAAYLLKGLRDVSQFGTSEQTASARRELAENAAMLSSNSGIDPSVLRESVSTALQRYAGRDAAELGSVYFDFLRQQPAVETAQPTTPNGQEATTDPETGSDRGADVAGQIQESPVPVPEVQRLQPEQEVTDGGVTAPVPTIPEDAVQEQSAAGSVLGDQGIRREGELPPVGEGDAQEVTAQESLQEEVAPTQQDQQAETVSRKLEPAEEFSRLATRGTGENPTPSEIDKIVTRLGVPVADVQDVSQEVAVKAAQSFNPEGGTAPLTWVNRVAQSTVADYFRRQGARKRDAAATVSTETPITEDVTVGETLISPDVDVSERVQMDEARSRVMDLLSDFPENDRNVMLLAMQGLSNAEIAAELNINARTVSGIKSRSLNKLKGSPYLLGIVPDNKFAMWLDKNFARLFKAEGALPVDVFKRWQRREGSVRSESKQIGYASRDLYDALRQEFGISKTQEFLEGMRQVPPEFVNRMNQALTGEVPISSLPTVIQKPIQSMRDHVDALSQRMIDDGIVPEELQAVIGDNMGVYLTRSYRMFDDPKWKDKITPEVRNKAINFILKENQSIDPSYTMEQAAAEVEAMLEDWSAQSSGVVVKKGSKLGSKDLSSLIRRKDIPKEIRDLLGEYRNPAINYARSVSKMSALIENQRFLKDVRDMGLGKFLFEDGTQPPGYSALIAAEGSQVMSPLNGLRTTPEIAAAFNEFGKASPPAEGWWRVWLTLNAISKTAKTVGSFMTQARNMLGQPVFWMMNGHWNPTELRKAQKAVLGDLGRNDKTARELYRRYVDLGIVDQSTMASELRDAINDARLADPNEDVFNQGVAATILKNLRKVTIGAAERAYQLSDDIGKIVGFENELSIQQKIHPDKPIGELEQIAAERVRNGYPTYSMVPEWVKKFRRQPFFGPFVTFSYEAYRTLIHNLRYASEDINSDNPDQRAAGYRRASGIIGALAGSYVLSGISRALLGISPEEERDARRFMAPWDKNSQLLFTNKEPGKLSFINLSYVNPYSGIADISIPLVSGIAAGRDADMIGAEMFAESIQPFASEGIFTAKLLDVMRNQTEQGRRVYNPSDPDKYEKMTRHIADSLVPGTIDRAVKRIGPAFMGKTTNYGQALNPAQEVISELTGFKQQTTDYVQALGYKAGDFRDNDNDAEGIFRETALNRGSVSPEDIVAAYARSNSTRFSIWKNMYQDIQAARRRGVTDEQIREALKSRNITNRDISLLLDGIYQPYRPSSQMMRSLRELNRPLPPDISNQISQTTSIPLTGELP